MDAAAELGRNPVSKHQIQPEYGDEQADAGRDCRTRHARPDSQARTRTGRKYPFPCSADHEQDWQPYPVDPHSCYNTCDQKKMEDKVRCSAVRGAVTLTESFRTGNYSKVATTVIGAEPVPRCVCPSWLKMRL